MADRIIRNNGEIIGSYAEVRVPGSVRIVFVGFAHDWDSDTEYDIEHGREYDPLCLGVFDDPAQIEREIELAARKAQGAV